MMTGPALYGVVSRAPSREWLHKWIKNPALVIESGDPYALEIKRKWQVTMDPMPLNDKEIEQVLKYIESYH